MPKNWVIASLALCVCAVPLAGAMAGDGTDSSYATGEIITKDTLSAIAGSAPQGKAGDDAMRLETDDAVATIGNGKYGITEDTAASGAGTGSHHAVAVTLDLIIDH